MAKQAKPVDFKTFYLLGLADVVMGLGLIVLTLMGVIPVDLYVMIPVGALIAVMGVGIALWGRSMMKRADTRGDRN